MKNLILIGMMGCGKTTVGTLLAQQLGLELVDTDQLIESREGRSIQQIFDEDGEQYFRALELQAAKELSQQEDLVISCGGGLPLQKEAIAELKQNGIVFWLKRDPEETFASLDTSGRPLAQQGREAFLERYNQRLPVYRAASDYSLPNEKTAQWAASVLATIYTEECS